MALIITQPKPRATREFKIVPKMMDQENVVIAKKALFLLLINYLATVTLDIM